MGVEEKNRNEVLSRIAADLFAATKGSEELAAKTSLLRNEIKKVIESDDTLYGKFRGLVESFREIIPDEKQRYNAALKALSTTSKVSRQEITAAVSNQVEELKILEKVLLNTPSGLRDELAAIEARSRAVQDELAKLREKIGQLESEEKELLSGMAMREKEVQFVSKAVADVFGDITAEIAAINQKVREISPESAAPQHVWPQSAPVQQVPSQQTPPQPPPVAPPANTVSAQAKESVEQKSEEPEPSAPQYGALQKKCPMCGGRMDLYGGQRMWKCFSCAYEEIREERGEQEAGEQKGATASASSAQHSAEFQKKCPMCGGRMDFYSNQNMWMCFSCAHEESGTDGGQNAGGVTSDSMPSRSFAEDEDSESQPTRPEQPTKKKTCPVCNKKMNFYQDDKAWRCPHCHYERRI